MLTATVGEIRGDLEYGVGNLTVHTVVLFRGYYINTIAQLVESVDAHGLTSDI